jgi:hypothetical protein
MFSSAAPGVRRQFGRPMGTSRPVRHLANRRRSAQTGERVILSRARLEHAKKSSVGAASAPSHCGLDPRLHDPTCAGPTAACVELATGDVAELGCDGAIGTPGVPSCAASHGRLTAKAVPAKGQSCVPGSGISVQ